MIAHLHRPGVFCFAVNVFKSVLCGLRIKKTKYYIASILRVHSVCHYRSTSGGKCRMEEKERIGTLLYKMHISIRQVGFVVCFPSGSKIIWLKRVYIYISVWLMRFIAEWWCGCQSYAWFVFWVDGWKAGVEFYCFARLTSQSEVTTAIEG